MIDDSCLWEEPLSYNEKNFVTGGSYFRDTNRHDESEKRSSKQLLDQGRLSAAWQAWPSDLSKQDAGLAVARDGFACEKSGLRRMKTETSSRHWCSFVFITVAAYIYIWVISRDKIEACLYGASACIIDVNHDATRRDSPIRCMQIMNDITDWLINKHDTERTCRANQFFFSFFPLPALLVSTSEVVPIRSDLVRSGIRKTVLRGTFSRF